MYGRCPQCGTQGDDQVKSRQVPATTSASRAASPAATVVIYCHACGYLYDVFPEPAGVGLEAKSVGSE